MYDYSFIRKDVNQNQPNKETIRMRPGREEECITLPIHQCVQQLGSISESCPEFLLGFYYRGMIN